MEEQIEKQQIEKLPKNVLFDLALKLELKDINSLCKTSTKFANSICNSSDFWRTKLRQDFNFRTTEKNTKKIYESIVVNKDYCNLQILEGKVDPKSYVLNSFDESFQGNDYLAFLYIRAKILNLGNNIPGYFAGIFNKYIKKINYKYNNKIKETEEITLDEILIFLNILKKIKGNDFQKAVAQRMIKNEIPLDIKWEDLCENYLIYFI